MIQIYEPSVSKEELKAIENVFNSKWIGKGSVTDTFVDNISKMIIGEHTGIRDRLITIGCCTEGLFQSMDLFGIKENDEVILPSVSWVGTGNAIVYKGAIPVFCDVDKRTLNPTAKDIEEKITNKTKAVIILHYAGVPCEIKEIVNLCKKYDLKLIEDNANSPFSKYKGQSTGTFGDMGIWSFDPMKIITTGDGGLIHCKDWRNIDKIDKMVYLGWDSSGSSKPLESKWWEYEVLTAGRRSIMNDIQSAIGVEQLKKVDSFISRRKEIHKKYNLELSKLDWLDTPIEISGDNESSYYMYHIQTKEEKDRDELARHLRRNGVYTAFRYYPLHKIDFYKSTEVLPKTNYVENHTLCIPIHQNLTESDVDKIINTIRSFK